MKKFLLIYLIFLSSFSFINAQWSIDPYVNNPVCITEGDQLSPKIINDGSGGAIITWRDSRNGIDNDDIYAQRINSLGNAEWMSNGVPVCTATNNQSSPQLVNDGSGGVIITWRDLRDGSEYDIYAQKINSSGETQWTSDGIPVCTTISSIYNPQIVSDGSGGAIITWYDYRSGNNNADIYAQKINSSGEVQWTNNGVPVCTAADYQWNPQPVNDGFGGTIITWYDYRNGGSDADIYAQRISSSGAIQWTVNGIPVCTAANLQSSPQIVSDGAEGVIIIWDDYRGSDADIYAQRISSSAETQWALNGIPVCTAANDQTSPKIIEDNLSGVIIAWYDNRNGGGDRDIYTQKINLEGNIQWTNNGVPVCTAANDQLSHQLVNSDSEGAIITWYDYRNGNNNSDIYAQKINSIGEVQWKVNGIPVCIAAGQQYSPQLINDGAGGTIITWYDLRNGIDKADTYVQRIDVFGYLGIVNPVLSSVNDVIGDQGGVVSLNWNSSAYDTPYQELITYYSIWRGIEASNGAALGKETKPVEMSLEFSGKAYRTINSLTENTYWEWLGNIPAHYLDNYSYTANTLSDSSTLRNPYFKFLVSAQTEDPFVFWDSNIDSGYSVDNLLPLRPQNLVATLLADRNIELSWSKNSVDPDVKNYQVHRSDSEGFTPNETTLISEVSDTVFVDTNVPSNISSVYYKITAVDIHGNVSLPSDEASITFVGVEEDNNIPLEYSLGQNYPNPFNPSTVINYQLADRSKVTLKVYNVLGDEIEKLVNEEKAAGTYKVTWNAQNLPSGVYFYKLQAGSLIQTKKMILLR